MKSALFLCSLSLGLSSPTSAQSQPSSVYYEARVYNPSCPGYFSVLHADLKIRVLKWGSAICAGSSVKAVDLVYSYRNAWTQHSWDRAVRFKAARAATIGEDADFWSVELEGEEVASRSRYQFSHLEFAWNIRCADGHEDWDNGGLAPLGFYSLTLPPLQCPKGEFSHVDVVPLASPNFYP